MRFATFVTALLLLDGAVDPTRNAFVVLTVFAGLAFVHWRPWRLLDAEPATDLRVVPFVLALLLLAGVIDPSRAAFIGLSVAAGLALVTPRLFWFGGRHHNWWASRRYYYARRHGGHWNTGWEDWR